MRPELVVALVAAVAMPTLPAIAADDSEAVALAETERAFARLCVEKGVRVSFLAYFSDDAVGFEPGPVKARETMLARPAPATKPAYTLDWWPEVVLVSRSGDFGWSTGPSHRTPDPGAAQAPPPNDGHYFSIWKKRNDGVWRVALDVGIDCPPGTIAPRGTTRLTRLAGSPTPNEPQGSATELQAEITGAVSKGDAISVLGRFASDARFYADGQPLVTGAEPARVALSKQPRPSHYEPAGADVAASGDLAVTYGRLDFAGEAGEKMSRWIVIVWQREEATNAWQVAGAAYDAPIPDASK